MRSGGLWNASSVMVDRPFWWFDCGEAPFLFGVPDSLLGEVVVAVAISPSASSRITPSILLMMLLTANSFD